MKRATSLGIAVLALLTGVVLPVSAQEETISFRSTELAPGLYMLEGTGGFAGGNLGLLVGPDGVFLIDDGLPPLIGQVEAAIDKITDQRVEFLINTHVHGDHIGGNEALGKEGATIVAHDNLRSRLLAEGMTTPNGEVPAPADALPIVTFSDAVTFHINSRSAFVFHVERAHTDGDAVIHFREDDVIHAGDVFFNGMFPFIDLDSGGSVEGYIAAQKRVLEVADADTRIIPGHGPLGSEKELQAAVDMLEDSLGLVRAMVEAGASEEKILAAAPLSKYESWSWPFITTERMTQTLYRSLTEAEGASSR